MQLQVHPQPSVVKKNCQKNAQNATIKAFSAHETNELQTYLSRKYSSKTPVGLYGNLGSKEFFGGGGGTPESLFKVHPSAKTPGYAYAYSSQIIA